MEKKKIELDKKKDELYQRIREDLNTHIQGAKNNINLLAKEEDERREDILFYENYKFNLALEKDAGNRAKKINSQNKTIENQIETENRMKLEKEKQQKLEKSTEEYLTRIRVLCLNYKEEFEKKSERSENKNNKVEDSKDN